MPLVLPQQVNLGMSEVGNIDVVAFVSVAKVLEKWFTATDIATVILNAGNLDPTMLTDFLMVSYLLSCLLYTSPSPRDS